MTVLRSSLLCVLLALATFAAFVRLPFNDFAFYDDEKHISKNTHVNTGLTAKNIKWALTTGYAANWQPLTWTSHMLDCQLFGLKPAGHHLHSLILHIINSILILLVLNAMTRAFWQSAFVAAAFALHPMHVESVAWVSERKDVLSTLFFLLTIASYHRYVEFKSTRLYLLTLFLFALGLMAKPMLVTLPFILLLLDYWPLNRFHDLSQPASRKTFYFLVREKLPFFGLAAVSSVVTFFVQHAAKTVSDIKNVPIDERLANCLASYIKYIYKMFWPSDLAILYPFTKTQPPLLLVLAMVALPAISIAVCFAVKRRYLAVGWFWYFGTLIPVIGLVQIGAQALADRYFYIPSIGLFIIIAWGLNDLLMRLRYRKPLFVFAGIAVLSALSVCTFRQTQYWKNGIVLFEHTIAVTSRNSVAHTNLGFILAAEKKYDQAVANYLKALEIDPSYANAMTFLGCTYSELGRSKEAIELHKKALQIDPEFALAYYGLGVAYSQLNRYTEAIQAYKKAIELEPESALAYYGLGVTYSKLNQYTEAIQAYKKAIELEPESALASYGLGAAYGKLNQYSEAIQAYKKALELEPGRAEAYYDSGIIYDKLAAYPQAVKEFEQAIKIAPNYPEAFQSLGFTLGKMNLWQKAADSFKQAVKLKPDYAKAHFNLAFAFDKLGHFQDAADAYKQAIAVKPDYPEAFYGMALEYNKLGRQIDYIHSLEQTVTLKPNHVDAHYNLALAYAAAGSKDLALRQYEILKSLDPNSAQAISQIINK